jgi:hypothetical protein
LKLTDEDGRDAFDRPPPRVPEESLVLLGWMVPVKFIELDGMVNCRDHGDRNEVSKQGRIESSMIVDYIKVASVCESGGHRKNFAKNSVRSIGDA